MRNRWNFMLCVLALGLCTHAVRASEAELPVAVAATDTHVRYVGRFDTRDTAGPRCTWSASTVALKFQGTDLNVKLNEQGHDRWQVEVDGAPTTVLEPESGAHVYPVAAGLPDAAHTVLLVKATEGFVGITQFLGFELNAGGKLLPNPPARRRIEVIGDSISCAYGNEGANQNEHFSPKTENAYYSYGDIAARKLGADYDCVAYSGRKMWPDNTIGELYDRALTDDAASQWDFSKWSPDVIVINLATNDFGKAIPEEAGWTTAYEAFIKRLRTHYPRAVVYCAIGTMMGDWSPTNKPLTTLRAYLKKIVSDMAAAGDLRVHVIDFGTQDMKNGLGSDWHPSKKTHEIMAAQLVETLRHDMDWK